MPHKHKRKRDTSPSSHDLPPSSRARPLPIHKSSDPIFTTDVEKKRKFEARRQKKLQKKNEYKDDDTPKSFKRLMAFQEGKKTQSGVDDGPRSSTKRTQSSKVTESAQVSEPSPDAKAQSEPQVLQPEFTSSNQPHGGALKILPSESLSTFALRVDQSLPLSSLPKNNPGANPPGSDPNSPFSKLKTPLTKHNKRLARMQKDWRATEERLKAKDEDRADELADQKEEDTLLWLGAGVDPSNASRKSWKRKKGGRSRDADDADPWKVLEKTRHENGLLKQKGLQDVVSAPPVLKPLKNIFRDRAGDSGASRNGGMSRAVAT